MEKWIDSAFSDDNGLSVRLNFDAKSIVITARKVSLHHAAVTKSGIEIAGRGLSFAWGKEQKRQDDDAKRKGAQHRFTLASYFHRTIC